MDKLTRYRDTIERVLRDYAQIPYSHGELRSVTVFDRQADHYLLMVLGREGTKRVHGCLVHVDIEDGRFFIRRDGTEYSIARELMDAGVPAQDVVLAFRLPEEEALSTANP